MESFELLRILDEIKSLKEEVVELAKRKEYQPEPYRSTEINELASALSRAQSEMQVAEYSHSNKFYGDRYADIVSVVNATRGALTKQELAVVQDIIHQEDGCSMLYTIMMHSSGQWILSRMRIVPPKNDVMTINSYTQYLRRITYASLVGCVTAEEDDDGDYAMIESRKGMAKGVALNTKYDATQNSVEVITPEQLEDLEYELGEYEDIAKDLLLKFNLNSIADLPKEKFKFAINKVREFKQLRSGASQPKK